MLTILMPGVLTRIRSIYKVVYSWSTRHSVGANVSSPLDTGVRVLVFPLVAVPLSSYRTSTMVYSIGVSEVHRVFPSSVLASVFSV